MGCRPRARAPPAAADGVHSMAATTPKGRVLHALARDGIALLTAHTNADVPADGVNESLARAVGIVDPRGRAGRGRRGPRQAHLLRPGRRRRAGCGPRSTEAGAGAIGDYDSCTFSTPGEGRFRPLAGREPGGRPGRRRRGRRGGPRRGGAAALPPYGGGGGPGRGAPLRGAGLRRGRARRPATARPAAATAASVRWPRRPPCGASPSRCRDALPATAHGVRVAGDPDRPVERVVVGQRLGRLPARHRARPRRRRLRHLRPAPPPGRGVPRARGSRPGRRRPLGGGVDLAAGGRAPNWWRPRASEGLRWRPG